MKQEDYERLWKRLYKMSDEKKILPADKAFDSECDFFKKLNDLMFDMEVGVK